MFKKGNWEHPFVENLRMRLQRQQQLTYEPMSNLRRIVWVELGLVTLANLPLPDESILALPDLLTLHELPSLRHLTSQDWQLIRFTRYRLPGYTSRQRWGDDLRDYAKLADVVQLFELGSNDKPEDLTITDLIKPIDNHNDMDVYTQFLWTRPPYNRYSYHVTQPNQRVEFFVDAQTNTRRSRHKLEVQIPEDVNPKLPAWKSELPDRISGVAFEQFVQQRQKSERPTFTFDWTDIENEAQIMHKKDPDRKWRERINNMALTQHSNENGVDGDQFVIDGTVHVAGMVGSGKSTLVKTIIHHLCRTSDETVIAVLVPSTMEAFNFAHEINALLGIGVENTPIAVAYYGWTNRDKHVQAFLDEHGHNSNHIGQRWVSTSCALMSLIQPADIVIMGAVPRPGSEPCEKLSTATMLRKNDNPVDNDESSDTETDAESDNKRYSCPYFSECPSRQLLRDLQTARVIVTTAGGLQSRLPVYIDPRRLLLADYIYEKADLMFVDEADEVQAFEDDQFVNSVPLWRLPNALFSSADASISDALVYKALNEIQENWSFSLRDGAKYILPMLRMLNQVGSTSVKRWVGRSYFSSYRLFQTLARRMLGIPDWVAINEMTDEESEMYYFISDVFSLLTAGDFKQLPDPDYVPIQTVRAFGDPICVWYAGKLRDILAKATDNVPQQLLPDLEALVVRLLSEDNLQQDIDANLQRLHARKQEATIDGQVTYKDVDKETLGTFVRKLMFALLAAGLDREIKVLVYNADDRPNTVTDVDISSFNPNFRSEHKVLPLAYTGPVFGTYFTPDERDPEQRSGQRGKNESLSRLEYINPGRELLLRFHELYEPFNIYGPHVVFLSGTSHLPDSTRWHIRTPVTAVLEANQNWRDTIRQDSDYSFEPAFVSDKQGKQPIRVSGASSVDGDYDQAKIDALRKIAQWWADEKTLENELTSLLKDGGLWEGRDRILLFVNSYPQAKKLGEYIRQYTSFTDEQVQWLKPGADDRDDDGIARASIERVAETNLKILTAPLLAIGRGHNILTPDGSKAAFGAVYFVVRPLNPPGEVNGIAAEINAYGYQWLANPHPEIITKFTVREQETELRRLALNYWHRAEKRSFYSLLSDTEINDLAATTLGRFVQASGRLVRGGVPMRVRFVDAAWAPESANHLANKQYRKSDSVRTSLLAAMICRLSEYTSPKDEIGRILYEPFIGLKKIRGLRFDPNRCHQQGGN